MRLRDDVFLNAPDASAQHQPGAGVDLDVLRGIGDPMQRQADDFVRSFGAAEGAVEKPNWSVGDSVEFTTPDAVRRTGSLCRVQSDGDWLVQVDEGTYNIVPEAELRRSAAPTRSNKRAEIRDILANTDAWQERHSPVELSEHDFRITIDYGVNNRTPGNDELCAYVERKYAARVIDAQQVIGGKLEVICTRAELVSPSDPTSTDQPGLETEEMEGTGKIGYVVESLKRVAALNTQYDFVAGTVTEDEQSVTAAFTLQAANGDKLYINSRGNITPVLSEDAAPAVGYLAYDGINLTGALHAAHGDTALTVFGLSVQAGVEPPYSSGDGALGTRTDDGDRGDYVVKAEAPGVGSYTRQQWEDEQARYYGKPTQADEEAKRQRERARQHRQQMEQAPPQDWMTAATEEDGEVREEIAGPGEVVAVDQNAKDYWHGYYGNGYGKEMTKDVKRSEGMADEIRAAWLVNQDRMPTDHEMIRTLAVLYSKRTAMVAMHKEAQVVPMREFINGLMAESLKNIDVQRSLDKMVTGYISSNPGQILEKLDKTIYPRLLFMMMQDPSKGYAKKLRKLHQSEVDPREHIKAPSAEEWQKDEAPEQPARPDLVEDLEVPKPGIPEPKGPGLLERAKDKLKGLMPKDKTQRALEKVEQEEYEEKRRQLEERPLQVHPSRRQRVTPTMRGNPRAPLIEAPPKGSGPTQMGDMPDLPREPRAANRQPAKGDMAAMKPRIENMCGQGSYLKIEVVWDPEGTEMMSAGNIRHQIISWVKGQESMKEYRDIGTLGKPRFETFDPDLGMATILVRSSEAENMPQEVVHTEGTTGDASA